MLTSLDLRYIVPELQQLVGTRIDNVYGQDDDVLLQCQKTGVGKVLLRITPASVFLTNNKFDDARITGFVAGLRKYLRGRKINSIQQLGTERILEFAVGKEALCLYVEVFNNGNMILCDEKKAVLLYKAPKKQANGQDLRTGSAYTSESQNAQDHERTAGKDAPDAWRQSRQEFAALFDNEAVSKVLAVKLSLGKIYSHEVCARAHVDPQTDKLSEKQVNALFNAYESVLDEKPVFAVVELENKKVPVPFILSQPGVRVLQQTSTFSEAIELPHAGEEKPNLSAHEKARQKVMKAIAMQEKSIVTYEQEAAKEQRLGEVLYEQYQNIKGFLDKYNAERKTKSIKELKQQLAKKQVTIDEKTGLITVEIQE